MRNVNKPILYLAIIAGCVMLYLFSKLNALYLFVFLVALTIFLIARSKKEDRGTKRFLITLIILIFISRFLLSLVVVSVRGGVLSQDEGLYSKKALIKAFEIKNPNIRGVEQQFQEYFEDYDMHQGGYGYNAYTAILGRFYYLFGYQTQAVRFINIFANILVFLLIFYLTKELFGSNAAKISSAIFAFYPSTTLWSVMIYVDTIVLLGISAYIYSLVKIIKKIELKWLLPMIIAAFVVHSVRKQVMLILIAVLVFVVAFKIFSNLTKRGKLAFMSLVLLCIIILLHLSFTPSVKAKVSETIQTLIRYQWGLAMVDDSGYLIYPRYCYQIESGSAIDLFKGYLKGMSYVLFSPFPWQIESKLQLMSYPQVILWYFMMPFVLYGFYRGYKINRLATLSIFLYSFLVFSLLALFEGNIGALFRHKDMVMPFLLIYFGGGVYIKIRNPNKK